MEIQQQLKINLRKYEQKFLSRNRIICQKKTNPYLIYNGKAYLAFNNNDYLGLANDPKIIEAGQKALMKYGISSSGSKLVNGYSPAHHALEEELADFTGYPKVILFSSGYMANLGVISAIADSHYHILSDKNNHASLLDGQLLSTAKFQRYRHIHIKTLKKLLQQSSSHYKLIISDGVFSTTGTIAPLPELLTLAKEFSAYLMIDDSHGMGCLGKQGTGCFEHFDIKTRDFTILSSSCAKAFGTSGAFIASDEVIIEGLIQYCRTYMYTSAWPAFLAEATRQSLKIIQTENWRREKLNFLINYFRKIASQLALNFYPSSTPIQSLTLSSIQQGLAIRKYMEDHGILITLLRPPSVANVSIRITLTANHTETHIDMLLETLNFAIKSML